MANYGNCIDWVLRLEDRTLRGDVVDLGDGGGRTRYGIAEKDNPEVASCFYTLPAAAALEIAKDFYWRKYWTPLCGASLPSDELAATLLSFAVNDGIAQAVRELQGVVGATIDGHIGNLTVAAIADAANVAGNLREAQEAFYRELVNKCPPKIKFLNGWLSRARAVFPDLPA